MEAFQIVGKIFLDGSTKSLSELDKLSKRADQTHGAMAKMANGLKIAGAAIGAMATVAAAGITAIASKGVKLASDLAEVQNVVDTTFGDSAAQINDWSKKAGAAFGLSELEAKKYTGTLGAMLKSSGITGDKIADMSTKMAGLAGDFSSFYNIDHEAALEKIRSGLSGETEPLKQLGINMSVANLEAFALSQGIKKPWEKMKQSEQVMIRYNYLLKASADASGDFAKTSGSFANQQRILKMNFESMAASLGKMLLPQLNNFVGLINGQMPKIQDLLTPIFSTIGKVLSQIGPKLIEIGSKILPPILKLVDGLLPALMPVFDLLADAATSAFPILQDLMSIFVRDLLPPLLDLASTIFNNVIKPLMPIIKSLVDSILPPLTGILKTLIGFLKPIFETLGSVLKLLGETPIYTDKAGNGVSALGAVFMALGKVIGFVLSLLGALLSSLNLIATATGDLGTLMSKSGDEQKKYAAELKKKYDDVGNSWVNLWDYMNGRTPDMISNLESINVAAGGLAGSMQDFADECKRANHYVEQMAKLNGISTGGWDTGGSTTGAVPTKPKPKTKKKPVKKKKAALGGRFTESTLLEVAEAGYAEYAIPMDGSKRSNELLQAANKEAGIGGGQVIYVVLNSNNILELDGAVAAQNQTKQTKVLNLQTGAAI